MSSSSERAATTPNLEAYTDQFYGVMMLTLRPGGYAWDYESALRSPTAPASTPSSHSDTGSASCHGAERYPADETPQPAARCSSKKASIRRQASSADG